MEKQCTDCGELKNDSEFYIRRATKKDGLSPICKDCDRERRQEWSENNRERQRENSMGWARNNRERSNQMKRDYIQRNPEKRKAHAAVGNALRSGVLKREPCRVCGEAKAQAHHDSYEQDHRLDVRWLCKYHHDEHHLVQKMLDRIPF